MPVVSIRRGNAPSSTARVSASPRSTGTRSGSASTWPPVLSPSERTTRQIERDVLRKCATVVTVAGVGAFRRSMYADDVSTARSSAS